MQENRLECLRCRGFMEPGFVMDRADYNLPSVAQWVEGVPEKSIWTGLKTKGRESFPVMSYRCDSCGYLESYARPRHTG